MCNKSRVLNCSDIIILLLFIKHNEYCKLLLKLAKRQCAQKKIQDKGEIALMALISPCKAPSITAPSKGLDNQKAEP